MPPDPPRSLGLWPHLINFTTHKCSPPRKKSCMKPWLKYAKKSYLLVCIEFCPHWSGVVGPNPLWQHVTLLFPTRGDGHQEPVLSTARVPPDLELREPRPSSNQLGDMPCTRPPFYHSYFVCAFDGDLSFFHSLHDCTTWFSGVAMMLGSELLEACAK